MKKITFLFFTILMSALSWQGMAQSGSTCDGPLVVDSMPFNDSGNTATYGNNYSSSDVPTTATDAVTNGTGSASYLSGDEVVYSYTPVIDGSITINTTNDDDWIGLWVFTGCPFTSTVGYDTSTSGATRSIPNLPVIVGETYYIVISTWAAPQSTNYTLNITGPDVGAPPTCLRPTNLISSNLTVNSADVSWTEEGTASTWEIEYGESGFSQGDGTMETNLTSTSYSITGLDTSTAYEVYVRADCGAGDESLWTGPMSFRTLCDVISNLPYVEDFDTYGTGSDAFPACWARPVTYTSGTTWPSIVSRSGTSSAPNALKFQSEEATPTYAVSPPFAEDIDNLRVSFMLKREGANSGTIDVGVMSDQSDITTFELVATIDPDNNDFIEYVFDLNQVTVSGSGNFIALRHNSNSSVWYYWVDDFHVSLVPTCPEPTDLTVDNTTYNSDAEISWTAGDTETSWNISWGPSGYTPGDSDEIDTDTASVTNYEITGLGVDIYDVYVQANCGVDDLSYWTGPVTFTTGYCIPTGSSNNGDEIRNFTLSNLDNDSDTSEGTDGYSNYSSSVDPAELEAGETYIASLTSGVGSGNHGAALWIDYDQNGVFDESEMVAYTSGITASETVNFPDFTVPASALNGTYRLRVQYHYNKDGDELDPCLTTSGFSETEDYAVTISGGDETGYCTPVLDCTDGDVITNVTFMEIDNTTTCSPDGYGDYTHLTATVGPGRTYPISVSVGDGFAFESVSVWIDFDESGTFDEDEFFYIGTGSDEALTSDITIPSGLDNGDYRMRVRVAAAGESLITWDLACDEDQAYGETEDYTVTVDDVLGMDDNVITNFIYYPNPMQDVLHITADLDIKSVAVFNVLGQEVLGNKHFTNNKVDVSALPTGTFIFRVTFDNGNIKNFKAVKK